MFRVSDIIDLPILPLEDEKGSKCIAKSLLFDGLNNKLSAIVCKEVTLLRSIQIIPYRKIIAIDTNGIVISNISCIQKAKTRDISKYLQYEEVVNCLVKGCDGDLYGKLTDIFINLLNGKITAFELSEGYIDDIVRGRKVINISDCLKSILSNKEITLNQRLN